MRTLTFDKQRILWYLFLAIAIFYFILGGVFSLWYPTGAIDLYVLYAAGITVLNGGNPYIESNILETYQLLSTPLSGGMSTNSTLLNFTYPPPWILFSSLISLLPWPISAALWKIINITCFFGSVLLSLRLFDQLSINEDRWKQRIGVWIFALTLSPTLTILGVGQTTFFILLMTLSALVFWKEGKSILSGACLALALVKPQLTLPVFIFFVWRREYKLVISGCVIFVLLWFAASLLSGVTISDFFHALKTYTGTHQGENPRNVGLHSLFVTLLGLSATGARIASMLIGVLALGVLFLIDANRKTPASTKLILVLLMLFGPVFIGTRSYDLAFIIPAFTWLLYNALGFRPFAAPLTFSLCLLFVPLQGVILVYDRFAVRFLPAWFFEFFMVPFRSWVAVLAFGVIFAWVLSIGQSGGRRMGDS